ncbi:WD40 repeat domain-containing protein, partial [Streptomyces rubiginosohelvolus]|uniref:WD40 repeat domain-containing protein n=1 Tax=Streptomyces rubiginosohelvolus TaxID=67362 RepID=UPI0033A377D6
MTPNSPPGAAGHLFDQLLDSVPRDPDGGFLWQHAVGYLLRHTARHAVDAGRLDELLDDADYLQYADPHALANALAHANSLRARLHAAVYRASWGVHHTLPPTGRRQLLALDAARFRNQRLQSKLPGDADWTVRWATGSQVSPSLVRTLTGHTGTVDSVAVAVLEGRPHVVTGGSDSTVRVWDLATGTQTLELTGHTDTVDSVAVAVLEGRPHVVAGGSDSTVRVWDLATGTQTLELTGHTDTVDSVAVAVLEGHPHVVTGSYDGSVRVWDLAAGTQTLELTGHSDAVAVAVAVLEGRPHVVAGGSDSTVRVWDLATGTQTLELTGHTDTVDSVA